MQSRHELGHIMWAVVFFLMAANYGSSVLLHFNMPIIFAGWWTLLLIFPCAFSIVRNGLKIMPAFGIVLGVTILLRVQNLVRFWKVGDLFMPTVFITAGIISIAFRKTVHDRIHNDGRPCKCGILEEDIKRSENLLREKYEKCKRAMEAQRDIKVYFGKRTITYDGELFEGASIKAIFGKCTLDLRNAVLVGNIEITNMVICGKVEVLLPESVKAEVVGLPIIGEIDNKAASPLGDINARLSIPSVCVLSEMSVV